MRDAQSLAGVMTDHTQQSLTISVPTEKGDPNERTAFALDRSAVRIVWIYHLRSAERQWCRRKRKMKGEMIMFKNLFKKKKNPKVNVKVWVSTSCEDPNTTYLTFPDGLRLRINDGKYVGWYVTGAR